MRATSNQWISPLAATGLYLTVALSIGGAGTQYPLVEMTVEVLGVALLLYFLCGRGLMPAGPGARLPSMVAILIAALPLLQLIPLPPDVWTRLPGRRFPSEILTASGIEGIWLPLSLDTEATRKSALALVPGLAMFVAVLHLSSADRIRLVHIVIAFALFGVALGALQVATAGAPAVTPFSSSHRGQAIGLFTNRNHQASLLLIAAPLAAATARAAATGFAATSVRVVAAGAVCLFGVGVMATTSRAGVALLPLSLGTAFILLFPGALRWRTAFVGAVGLAVLVFAALQNQVVANALSRYANVHDVRFDYWSDVWWGVQQYWPIGSGIGTFKPVFNSVESLAIVGPAFVNHAHNDYLELVLEAGAPAVVLFACFAWFVGTTALRLLRAVPPSIDVYIGRAALVGVLLILLHSIVDYPLRMLSLETIFGLLCGLLVAPSKAGRRQNFAPAA